jgi:hypothetical protein
VKEGLLLSQFTAEEGHHGLAMSRYISLGVPVLCLVPSPARDDLSEARI